MPGVHGTPWLARLPAPISWNDWQRLAATRRPAAAPYVAPVHTTFAVLMRQRFGPRWRSQVEHLDSTAFRHLLVSLKDPPGADHSPSWNDWQQLLSAFGPHLLHSTAKAHTTFHTHMTQHFGPLWPDNTSLLTTTQWQDLQAHISFEDPLAQTTHPLPSKPLWPEL